MVVRHLLRSVRRWLLLGLGLAALAGCDDLGPQTPCSRYPGGQFQLAQLAIADNPDHPPVDRHTVCAACHAYAALHRENCTGFPFIDIAAVQQQVDEQGEGSCRSCHQPSDAR